MILRGNIIVIQSAGDERDAMLSALFRYGSMPARFALPPHAADAF